jgi:nucleotide-binding universal stress UspA family protein
MTLRKTPPRKLPKILIAVDFSPCSGAAIREAKSLAEQRDGAITALHVIDHDFVEQCIREDLGNRNEIKRKLFLNAKRRLRDFLHREGAEGDNVEMVVREGTPCIEINKEAVECGAEMIVMGSRGHSDDMKAIFFGSTTERVLRFIKRPVLCVPFERHKRSSNG